MAEKDFDKNLISLIIDGIRQAVLGIVLFGVLFGLIGFVIGFYSGRPEYTVRTSVAISVKGNVRGGMEDYSSEVLTARMLNNTSSNENFKSFMNRITGVNTSGATIRTETVEYSNFVTVYATSSDPVLSFASAKSVISCFEYVLGKSAPNMMLTVLDSPKLPENANGVRSEFRFALFGFILGMAIATGIIAFLSMNSKALRSPNDIKDKLKLSLIATLPFETIKSKGESGKRRILIDNISCGFLFSECVKKLRSRVLCEMGKNATQTVMVTSCFANEGKTTVSINLALAIAREGHKVLLIDLDLRNPSVHKHLSEGSDEGKTVKDVLANGFDMSAVKYLDDHGIYVLTGGKKASSTELNDVNVKLRELLHYAKKEFDYIVIDTSPSFITPETFDFSEHIDCSILVVREGTSVFEPVLKVAERLKSQGGFIGCVANCSKKHFSRMLGGASSSNYDYYNRSYYSRYRKSYSYGKKYGYGYGYGYGDSENKSTDRKKERREYRY